MSERWKELKKEQEDNDLIKSALPEKSEDKSITKEIDNQWKNINDSFKKNQYKVSYDKKYYIRKRMNQIIDDLIYTDNEFPKSHLDIIHDKMKKLNWTWSTSENGIPASWEILKCLEKLFDDCFNIIEKGEDPIFFISTAGWTVTVNILNETVEAYFNIYDSTMIDYDN